MKKRRGVWLGGLLQVAIGTALTLWLAPISAGASSCPNDPLRTGPSANLPDCRAYELVTPPDTNGRLVETISTFTFAKPADLFPTELASPSHDRFAYLTYNGPLRSPRDPNGVFDLYGAERLAPGWQTTRHLSLPAASLAWPIPGGVSSDHAYAFGNEARNDYLVAADGSSELTAIGSLGAEPRAQGRYISSSGAHVIFSTGKTLAQSEWCGGCPVNQLEPDAPPTGTGAVYDRSADGPTQVVSLLPGEVTPKAGEEAFWKGTSKDGTATAFEIEGVLYVRLGNEETKEVAAGKPLFAGLSDDGRFVFYVSGGDIHRLDTETEEDDQVNATGDAQVANVSADGSHVYFLSESEIGGEGTAGQPNMYVWSGGAPEFVATVSPADLEGVPALDNWTSLAVPAFVEGEETGPGASSTRTTSDGSVLVFESKAELTPYDNDGHTEIYRWDDEDDSLTCVSCNPLAEPASADARLQELALVGRQIVVRNLTDDGARVFFETPEALLEADTDGINDIYQWHEEEGEATVNLISSGKTPDYPLPEGWESPFAPRPNLLFGVTPDGSDVFFLSQDALVPGAGESGVPAIYDARVNGGFPVPEPPVPCLEEDCRPDPSAPPLLASPTSEGLLGSGNVKPRKRKPHCRRPKHKKHRHCRRTKATRRHARAEVIERAVEKRALDEQQQEQQLLLDVERDADAPRKGEDAPAPLLATQAIEDFGIEAVEAKLSTPLAGMHPDFTTNLVLNNHLEGGHVVADANTEDISVSLPPGLLGNSNAIPRCEMGDFLAFGNCPIDSQVGITQIQVGAPLFNKFAEPIYNLAPPHPDKEVARFGFIGGLYPVFIDIEVRTASDYGVTATVHSAPGLASLVRAKTTLWGEPADPSHDEERITPFEATKCETSVCKSPKRESGIEDPKPFLTNPSACQSHSVGFAVTSYQLPGQVFSKSAPPTAITDCIGLPFAPTFSATPTNPKAGAQTGLKTTLTLPQVEEAGTQGTATMKEARIAFPEGMTIAAGAADGLEACSDEQVGYHEEVDAACPDASKLGVATISSPALPKPLQATLYQRTPEDGRLFGLWLVTDELGLHVKIPGEIEADKETGQLTAVFTDLPQVPVEQISINVWGGDRAPLKNPDSCGTYSTSYAFTPHSSDPVVNGSSQMTIDQGCDTGGFSPRLSAGATNPIAGAFSPMVIDLAREDGEQNLGGIEVRLPDGQLAKLAGVPLCPEEQAANGACSAASQIGRLNAAVGPGPKPLWLPQEGKDPTAVYLGGPYKGAPFSVITVVPAQAGPFDLGDVVVRSALNVDPESARATVVTDPLPQFIEGVAAVYRRLHVVVDRPEFALNPTDCSELQTNSLITSTQGAVANPASRFQVDGCKALGFKPKLSLKLKGGTKRGDYPALSAVVKARPGDANIGRVSVALPHSEFLAQEHIQTICTRVRFAQDTCPKGSIYGRAKAWTPLLDQPLEGPVHLRSSDNPLPDLVMALEGQIAVNLVGRIDSKDGGIRTTFDRVPDAPITRFVLKMRGGKKSLLVNSTDLCKGRHRSTVRMRGQNGRVANSTPLLFAAGCGKKNGRR